LYRPAATRQPQPRCWHRVRDFVLDTCFTYSELTDVAASSCFVALVFGILWPTSGSGMSKRPNLSAYKKGAALETKKD
jgi:hypothetical protein